MANVTSPPPTTPDPAEPKRLELQTRMENMRRDGDACTIYLRLNTLLSDVIEYKSSNSAYIMADQVVANELLEKEVKVNAMRDELAPRAKKKKRFPLPLFLVDSKTKKLADEFHYAVIDFTDEVLTKSMQLRSQWNLKFSIPWTRMQQAGGVGEINAQASIDATTHVVMQEGEPYVPISAVLTQQTLSSLIPQPAPPCGDTIPYLLGISPTTSDLLDEHRLRDSLTFREGLMTCVERFTSGYVARQQLPEEDNIGEATRLPSNLPPEDSSVHTSSTWDASAR